MSEHGRTARVRSRTWMAIAAAAVAALAALAGPAPAQAQTDFGVPQAASAGGPVHVATLNGERVKVVVVPGGETYRAFLTGAVGSRKVSWCGGSCSVELLDWEGLVDPLGGYDPHEYQLSGGKFTTTLSIPGANCTFEDLFPWATKALLDELGLDWADCFVISHDIGLSAPGLWGYIAPPTAKDEDGDDVVFHDWKITSGLADGFCGTGNVGYRRTLMDLDPSSSASFPEWEFPRGITVFSYVDINPYLPYGMGVPASYELLYAPASPDVTKPIVTVRRPVDCMHLEVGQAVTVDYECDDLGSGVDTCTGTQPDGAALDTSRLGERQFTVTGTDNQGHARTRTVRYFVEGTYGFTGFAAPIDNGFTNTAKAGQAIPVKYRLTTPAGTPVSDPASFVSLTSQSGAGSCAGLPADAIETYSGSSGLQYLGDGNWQFNWKTPKNYAGQCRTMTLTLNDDSTHTAAFSFK